MTSNKQRKNHNSEFKAKVALEAVRGRLTINEISKEFGVHPNQISKWKKQFSKSLPQIFENSKRHESRKMKHWSVSCISKSGS